MKSHDSLFPHAAAGICGFVVYVAITSATGKNEAWDDGSYYTIGVPVMSIVAFVIGYRFPHKPWRWALSMAGGQVLAALLHGSSLNLLPIAMIFMAVISTPQVLAAFIGSKLSPKKAAQ